MKDAFIGVDLKDTISGADLPLYNTKRDERHILSKAPSRGSISAIATLVTLGWIFLAPHYYGWPTTSGSNTRNPAYLVQAKSGAVASENILCSEIGVEVLKDGGNAVDSAVATTLCIGVVNMFS